MSTPAYCQDCDHKRHPQGGWCYMFRTPPDVTCMQHSSLKGVNVFSLISQVSQLKRKDQAPKDKP